ncbi:MAG: hypothetical protein ABWY50_08590 [Aeromicrobium sp.]
MRRSLALVLVIVAVVVPGCARGTASTVDCREDFMAYHDQMGEYGNPGGPSLPTLTARWDSLFAAFERLGRSARSSDCADLDRLSRTVESVEYVLVTAGDYDMAQRLAGVEDDLAKAQRAGRLDPTPADVATAIESMRVAAPLVTSDLAAPLAALDRADPLDTDAVDAARAALTSAADASQPFQGCLDALESLDGNGLGDFEATIG